MLGMHVGKGSAALSRRSRPSIVLPAGLEDVIQHGLGEPSRPSASRPRPADYLARLDGIMPAGSGQLDIAQSQAATWVPPPTHPTPATPMPHAPTQQLAPVTTPTLNVYPTAPSMSIPPKSIKIGWIVFAAMIAIGIVAAIVNHTSKPAATTKPVKP